VIVFLFVFLAGGGKKPPKQTTAGEKSAEEYFVMVEALQTITKIIMGLWKF